MTSEMALEAFEEMLPEINKENHLFVGTINPEMIKWAINGLRLYNNALAAGYAGKELRFGMSGRLFAVRELAQ